MVWREPGPELLSRATLGHPVQERCMCRHTHPGVARHGWDSHFLAGGSFSLLLTPPSQSLPSSNLAHTAASPLCLLPLHVVGWAYSHSSPPSIPVGSSSWGSSGTGEKTAWKAKGQRIEEERKKTTQATFCSGVKMEKCLFWSMPSLVGCLGQVHSWTAQESGAELVAYPPTTLITQRFPLQVDLMGGDGGRGERKICSQAFSSPVINVYLGNTLFILVIVIEIIILKSWLRSTIGF